MTLTIATLIHEFAQAYHNNEKADSTNERRKTEEQLTRAYGRLEQEIEQEIYNAKNGVSIINILDRDKTSSSNEAFRN
jgi:hypothetical protein